MTNCNGPDKLKKLLSLVKDTCSDIHISENNYSFCRINGLLDKLSENFIFYSKDITELLALFLTKDTQSIFSKKHFIDLSYIINGQRLRISIYQQNNQIALALRLISNNIPDLTLNEYPGILQTLALKNSGLILLTGPSGCGKSTTLAAMIKYRLQKNPCHVITLEDPIEYILKSTTGLVHQREYRRDFSSFSQAIKSALRQDPDVLLIGEIRDYKTMHTALTAAQTGHLVLSTLHTSSVVESIIRIEGFFEQAQREAIRLELSLTLQAVISQKLLLSTNEHRCCAMEILTSNDAVRNLIINGKPQQLSSIIQTNKKDGMQTLSMSIKYLRDNNLLI